jgi:hypothetical protein
MSSVVIAGNTSGTITLDAPNVAGTTTLTLPTTSGTVTTKDSNGILSVNGVQFPATQSASADANCLDDYEEGTWTSTVTSSGGSITSYTLNRAVYVKIGNTVYFNVGVTITSVGTASGAFRFTLPFTTTAVNAVYGREYAVLGYGFLGAMDASSVNAYAYAATANNGNAFAAGSGMIAGINGFYQV